MSNLEPGPELDQLVAEHVLKMIPCENWVPSPVSREELMKCCDHPIGTCSPKGMIYGYSTVPGWGKAILDWILGQFKPKNSLEITLQYYEKMEPAPWLCEIQFYIPEKDRIHEVRLGVTLYGKTLEHVYCLMALRLAGAPLDLSGYESEYVVNPSSRKLAEIMKQVKNAV